MSAIPVLYAAFRVWTWTSKKVPPGGPPGPPQTARSAPNPAETARSSQSLDAFAGSRLVWRSLAERRRPAPMRPLGTFHVSHFVFILLGIDRLLPHQPISTASTGDGESHRGQPSLPAPGPALARRVH